MNHTARWLTASLGLLLGLQPAVADSVGSVAPPRGTPYAGIRTWHEQAMALGPTKAQQLEILRRTVKAGPLGERGLDRMFRNFTGSGTIDPTIPGVAENLRLTASDSLQVRKGAARTQMYAAIVHNDPRFGLEAVNQRVFDSRGRMTTDRDIVWRHRATGQRGRIEVKDVSLASQRSNLPRYKAQLSNMAAEMREERVLQAWINRQAMLPELKVYARQLGIPVYESVVTSERHLGVGQMRMTEVLNDIERQSVCVNRRIAGIGGTVSMGFGLWQLYSAVSAAYEDLLALGQGGGDPSALNFRLGEHGLQTFAGAAFAVDGGAMSLATVAGRFGSII